MAAVRVQPSTYNPSKLVVNTEVVEVFARQVLKTGYFHCDPHPGNLCVNSEGQLVYYDCGMMNELQPNVAAGFKEVPPALECSIARHSTAPPWHVTPELPPRARASRPAAVWSTHSTHQRSSPADILSADISSAAAPLGRRAAV